MTDQGAALVWLIVDLRKSKSRESGMGLNIEASGVAAGCSSFPNTLKKKAVSTGGSGSGPRGKLCKSLRIDARILHFGPWLFTTGALLP